MPGTSRAAAAVSEAMTRWLAAIVVAAAGLLALTASGTSRAPAVEAPAAASAGPVTSERPAGKLVAVSGSNRLTVTDVATGRRTVRRLRSLAGCGPQLEIVGGRVVFAGMRRGRTEVYSLPLSLDGAPAHLGPAHSFAPSATAGRVWLAGAVCTRQRMDVVRELTVGGRVTSETRRRVPGTWLVGAVERGLIVQRRRGLVLWNPRTGSTAPLGLEMVADVRGDVLVGCPQGSSCRELAIVDLASDRRVTLRRPPTGYALDSGAAFSPDGSLLAAPVVKDRRYEIALFNTADGSIEIVPGSDTASMYPGLSWSATSGWLYFSGPDGRLGAIRPGARRAVELPFRLPRGAFGFSAA
jgi:hypothetical protein